MPEIKTYKRGHKQTGGRGHQSTVSCGFCGTIVPRYKTFTTQRGFRITDPLLRKEVDRQDVSTTVEKVYACPACARHRSIVQHRTGTGQRIQGGRKKRGKR
ncbi:MAG: hypothetical protein KAT83_00190 [Candidatus Aenigmarchaeota archaeon]|nr:hypothetical protein [Candidatus Aenigmarchaeota archaeon]